MKYRSSMMEPCDVEERRWVTNLAHMRVMSAGVRERRTNLYQLAVTKFAVAHLTVSSAAAIPVAGRTKL